jgi:hypothetical protein
MIGKVQAAVDDISSGKQVTVVDGVGYAPMSLEGALVEEVIIIMCVCV